MTYRPILVIPFLAAFLIAEGRAQEPNDTLGTATVLPAGTFTTGLQSLGDGGLGITYADTTLGFFESSDFDVVLETDDNSSFLGNGLASQLSGLPVHEDGSVPLAVSGAGDFDFDGLVDATGEPHQELGLVDVILLIEPIVDGVAFDSTAELFAPLLPGEVLFLDFSEADSEFMLDWTGHAFTAVVDNTVEGGNDVDYWQFEGLSGGAGVTVDIESEGEVTNEVVYAFSQFENLLATNVDFQNDDLFSSFSARVPDQGPLILAVTGWDEVVAGEFEGELFLFGPPIGAHSQTGDYTLTLSYSGDADGDNDVDGGDLLDLLLGFGTLMDATRSQGDNDRDGDVDRDDLAVWQGNLGAGTLSVPPGQSIAIPEPGSLCLAIAVPMLWGLRKWGLDVSWSGRVEGWNRLAAWGRKGSF